MASFWSDLCTAAESQSLLTQLNNLYAIGGVTIVFFFVSAAAHGTAFVRWRKRSAEEKSHGWLQYGWFTGLSCFGSFAGAFAYAARMGNLSHIYISSSIGRLGNLTLAESQERNEVLRDMLRFSAAHWALLPLEIGFVIVAKLFVLQRMRRFASRGSLQGVDWALLSGRKLWRLFFTTVIACNVVGFCGNIAVSVRFVQSAYFYSEAAKAWAVNDAAAGRSYQQQAGLKTQDGVSIASVQRFCEVAVLIMVITFFLIVGIKSHRVIASALRTLFTAEQKMLGMGLGEAASNQSRKLVAQASVQGRLLQRKIVGTFVFVFLTVLVRSVFTVIYALAQAFQDYGNPCSLSHCNPCKNQWSNILFWIINTPTFQFAAMLISSPLALLVALWGMSGVQSLERMSSHQVSVKTESTIRRGNISMQ